MKAMTFFFALFSLIATTPIAQAQQNDGADGFDFDTLAACSVIYNRIADIYRENGESGEAASFADTALAYSASAYRMISGSFQNSAEAGAYSEDRMLLIVEDLNRSAEADDEGETGVIEEWLSYCDTLGPGVSQIISN